MQTSLGLDYIAWLLKNQGTEMSVFVLLNQVRGDSDQNVSYSRMTEEQLGHEWLLRDDSGSANRPDNKAAKAYAKRAREIETELEDAKNDNDTSRIQTLTNEHECLLGELSKSANPRLELQEKARKKVGNAIKRALDQIRKTGGLHRLADHFENCLEVHSKTKVYRPTPPIDWVL